MDVGPSSWCSSGSVWAALCGLQYMTATPHTWEGLYFLLPRVNAAVIRLSLHAHACCEASALYQNRGSVAEKLLTHKAVNRF